MTNNKYHILYLPRWYPNRYDPMFGLFIRRHAEAAALHHNISVVYAHANENTSRGFDIERNKSKNLLEITLYYRQSTRPVLGKIINAWRFLSANFKGIRMVQKQAGPFSLVHVHILTRLALIALWYKWTRGIPYLITEHWSRYLPLTGNFGGFFRKRITRLCVAQARMLSTVTDNLAQAMKQHKLPHHDYRILPNVVDVEVFKPAKHTNTKKTRKIVHISCFEDRSKNISGILRVLQQLTRLRNDFECVMIGDGMDFESMKRLARELGLAPEYVHFKGLMEGKALSAELASADFLLLFSHYENLPVVIPESFACGVPVISSDVGGIAEIVDQSNGLLVKAGDETGLLHALQSMLDQRHMYDAGDMRNKVVKTNSKIAVGEVLDSWYNEALHT